MDDPSHIKKEYSNKILCRACLSSDRALSPLGTLSNIYQTVCDTSCVNNESDIHLCWECTAVLKKVKLFKDRAVDAQRVLSYYNFDSENLPPCLSNLKLTETNSVTTAFVNEDKKECDIGFESDNKQIDIKQENELELESYDYYADTQNDYTYLEDLKSESKSLYKEIKKLNKKKIIKKEVTSEKTERKKNYKMIRNSTKDLLKRVRIGQNEMNTWRERVRNSDYYKNLKSKCEKCLSRYSVAALKIHNRTFHRKSAGPYSCEICQCYFASKQALVTHISSHYTIYECKACGYQCYMKEPFYRHVHCHDRTVQCLLCNAGYSSTRKFFQHYKAMHTVFICDHCGKKRSSKTSIERHIRINHDKRCNICKIQFKENKNLKSHIQLKHVKTLSEDCFCVLCNKQFDNITIFRRHIQTSVAHAHERNDRGLRKNANVQCPECDNVYKRKQYMINHYRHVHLHQSPYYCKECDKSFLNSTRYLEHMWYIHEGRVREKNKLCSICGRGFAQTRTLVNHMRTHTGEKPHECPHCDARFAQRTAMVTHVKYIHLKERRKGSPGYVAQTRLTQ